MRVFLGVRLGVPSRVFPLFYAGVSCDVAGQGDSGCMVMQVHSPPYAWAGGEERAPRELTAPFFAGDITAPYGVVLGLRSMWCASA